MSIETNFENKMNKDYTKVSKTWPGSYVWTADDPRVCDINIKDSGIPNIASVQTSSSTILQTNNLNSLIKTCTYNVADVSVIDQVDNFGIIYGDQDPDKVLLLNGFCKTNPTHERCVGMEQTLCDTFPFHPDCVMNVETMNWSWVYTIIIIALSIGLGYFMSSPSKKTEFNA